MTTLEIVLYIILFTAVTLALAIPAINWYKYNVSMVYKKKISVYILIVVAILAVVFLVFVT